MQTSIIFRLKKISELRSKTKLGNIEQPDIKK